MIKKIVTRNHSQIKGEEGRGSHGSAGPTTDIEQ